MALMVSNNPLTLLSVLLHAQGTWEGSQAAKEMDVAYVDVLNWSQGFSVPREDN